MLLTARHTVLWTVLPHRGKKMKEKPSSPAPPLATATPCKSPSATMPQQQGTAYLQEALHGGRRQGNRQ